MPAQLEVKVVPGATQTGTAGWLGGTLKVRVAAPPEKGKANAAVIELFAELLNIPRRNVTITGGKTSPQKVVQIEGLSQEELRERLAALDVS